MILDEIIENYSDEKLLKADGFDEACIGTLDPDCIWILVCDFWY